MAIIPVTLNDTFDQWRTKTNSLITQAEQIEDKANAAFEKANAANLFAYNISIGANSYANLVGTSGNAYTNFVYINATNYANLVGFSSNAHANSVGVSSNAFARTVGQASNAYADFVGVSANAFARTVGDAANSRTNFVGASGNAYTNFVGGLANTNAANATYLSTGTVPSARVTGSYTGITGVGTLTTGNWQATPLTVQYGGTGATNQTVARTNLGLDDLVCPTGAVMPFAGATAPSGWLLCFGQEVSRTTYSTLYSVLGGASSPYGQGNGSTTFNLPDLRGRVAAGKDNMGGTSANRLLNTRTVYVSTISQSAFTVTVTTTAAHGLDVGDSIIITGAGNAAFDGNWVVASVLDVGTESTRASRVFTFTRTTSVTITAISGGSIIVPIAGSVDGVALGASGGSSTHTLTVGQLPSHDHSAYYSRNTPSGGSGDVADFSHNAISGSGPYNTTTTGGNAPHNNLQPTIVLNYIIKI